MERLTTCFPRRLFRGSGGLLVTVALLAAACGGDNGGGSARAGDDGPAQPESADAVDRSAEFRYATTDAWRTLDPHKVVSISGAEPEYLANVYDRLVKKGRDSDGKLVIEPELATSWSFSEDGLSVEFELRDDVTFQDGTPFNANAVKANIERAKGPESTIASWFRTIESVEVEDDTHVVFRLSEPDAAAVWRLAIGTAGMMISPAAFDSDLEAMPVGSGPFTLVSAEQDGDTVFQRWDGYWDKGVPLLERVTISIVADGNARLNGLLAGQYDGVRLSGSEALQAERLEAEEGYHWVEGNSPISWALQLNANVPPLDDVRVRRAIYLAINRQVISEQVFEGLLPPAYQAFNNQAMVGHDPSLDTTDAFDPEEARRLVAEAGAEGTTIMGFTNSQLPQSGAIGQVAQQMLSDIGLELELVPTAGAEARSRFLGGEAGISVSPVIAEADPALTLDLAYVIEGNVNPAAPPPELVSMADEARLLPFGSDEREKAYQEISRYLVENPIHVPIVQSNPQDLFRPNVVGTENLVAEKGADINMRYLGKTGE